MVWHIFRKDLRLSWKFALLTAMLQWFATGMLKYSYVAGYRVLAGLRPLVRDAGTLAVFLLVVTVVQRDAVPGAVCDWLMRPIRRRDMLLAKFLFFVLAIQLPILLGCVAEGLVFGLGFGEAFFGALWQGAMLTLAVGVAALAISAMTASIVEAAIAAGICLLAAAVMMASGPLGSQNSAGAGVTEWIADMWLIGGMFAASAIGLWIQYRHRSTMRARVAWSVVFILGTAGAFLPVKAALAFEQRIAPSPGAGDGVRLFFDASAARNVAFFARSGSELPPIFLPIGVDGVTPGMAIVADRAEVRVTGAYGSTQALAPTISPEFASGHGYQSLVSGEFAPALRNELVHVHADYWLTLAKETRSYTMPEANGDARIPLLGKCRTSWASFGWADFRCVKAGPVAGCYSIVPERRGSDATVRCMSYAPSFVWLPDWDEIVTTQDRFALSNGGDANVSVRIYQPIDHFERSLDIPSVRLRDWEAAAPR